MCGGVGWGGAMGVRGWMDGWLLWSFGSFSISAAYHKCLKSSFKSYFNL